MKPHEKRALNFLINEYLLLQDYKLTSITFSDENPAQVLIVYFYVFIINFHTLGNLSVKIIHVFVNFIVYSFIIILQLEININLMVI